MPHKLKAAAMMGLALAAALLLLAAPADAARVPAGCSPAFVKAWMNLGQRPEDDASA